MSSRKTHAPPAAGPAYRATRLENGLTVATARMPHMTSVSLGIWVGVGSRHEPSALNGASHFIEHMLFKGTARRSALEISQAVEGAGGILNAWTSEEHTCFYSKARHDRFEELWEVLADMFLHSRFAPQDIAREREVIKEEVAMYTDDSPHYVHELLNAAQWPGQALGRSITGTERGLDRLRRAQLLGYFRSHYVSASTVICAAGRIEHAQVVRAVRRHLRTIRVGDKPCFAPARARPHGPVTRLHRRSTQQSHLALGIRACSRHEPDRFALRLLSVILGENASSRLFQVLREERGLAYYVQSSNSFFHDTGDLVVSAGVDTDNLAPVLRILSRELGRLARRKPGAAEVIRARDYVLGQMDLSLESTEAQMMYLGEQWIGYARPVSLADLRRGFSAVGPAEIHAVARKYLSPERYTLALISPLKNDRGLAKMMETHAD